MNRSVTDFTFSSPKSTRQSSKQFLTPRDKKSPDCKKRLSIIRSKISELIHQKGKVMKCVKKVEAQLKKTHTREQVLLKTWKEQEAKIQSLEKRKVFKLVFDSNDDVSENMKRIIRLSRFLRRFKELEEKESEIEELENELDSKQDDLSLDTRSSENGGSDCKESVKKMLLKNKLYKFSFKRESISFHNDLFKQRKDYIYSAKADLQAEVKSFEVLKEIFLIQDNKMKLLKNKVERQEQYVNNSRVNIRIVLGQIEELHRNNDGLKVELEGLKSRYLVKRKRSELEGLEVKVNHSLEKISILSDSIHKKENLIEFQKKRIKVIEKKLSLKTQSINAKSELLNILNQIEREMAIVKQNRTKSHSMGEIDKNKISIGNLIKEALSKQKEITSIETILKEL